MRVLPLPLTQAPGVAAVQEPCTPDRVGPHSSAAARRSASRLRMICACARAPDWEEDCRGKRKVSAARKASATGRTRYPRGRRRRGAVCGRFTLTTRREALVEAFAIDEPG